MPPLVLILLTLAACAAAASPAGPRPRSDVSSYLATVNERRALGSGKDDHKKLATDAELAMKAYHYLRGRAVFAKDDQTFASMDFFMRTGGAVFNPNRAQTGKLEAKLDGYTGSVLQTDLIYEALVATDGNLTMAFGSLAELFCRRLADFVPKVADMEQSVDGKNYYRFAGAFIGLHETPTRVAGLGGAYANIGGNPISYAGFELYEAWKSYFLTGQMKGVDTLKTLGPAGNGNIVDKTNQLQLGFSAAESLRGKL